MDTSDPMSPETNAHDASHDDLPRRVLDNLLEGCQVISPEFKYVYVNDAVAAHGRSTREQLLGRTMMEAYPGIEDTEMFGVLRRCMDDRTPRRMENEFTFPDGSKGWFELRFEPAEEGVVILSMDITERKHAEQGLQRSNRALTVLSECNQNLVRATDESRFMQDVCRLAVEKGGYRLAWIGMKDERGGPGVRPVASAGRDDGYTEHAHATWDESDRGMGPIGRAIRAGRPVVAQSIATDPDFEPWRKDALDRGLASCISLPIKNNGEVLGALIIYAAEPDAFDEAEFRLLEEMALDLGYGVTTLRAREKLRAIDERLEAVVQASPAAIFSLDAEGNVLTWNSGAERIFGWSEQETVGQRAPIIPEDKVEEHEALRRRILAGETFSELEVERLCKDGSRIWVSVSTAPLRDRSGTITGLMAVVLDISKRKQAEQALRESEQRFRELVANLEDVVFSMNTEGCVEFMSPAVERVYGFRPDEVVGRHYSEFVHPEDLNGLAASFERTMQGAIEPHEFRGFDKDGQIRWLRSKSRIRIEDGRPVGVDGVIVDYTELRQADEKVREAQRKHTTLLGNLPGMAYRCINDPAWTMDIVSDGCLELTGYTPDDLIRNAKRSYADIIHPEDRDRVWSDVQAAISEGRPFIIEYRIQTASGDVKHVWERGTAVRDAEGDIQALEGFVMDVTAETAAKAEKQKLEEQLRLSQRLEAVGQLAGGVAHDFNNLLSVIISYAGFAADELRESDPIHADIMEIQSAGQRAASLTRQLLAFSRKQVLEPEVLNLNKTVTEIESMLRRLLGEDIDITVRLADDLGTVEVDPGQIEQVIMNLAVNARDAMPKGGKLTIETASVELDENYADQHVSVKPGRYVMLTMTDTGFGMDAATREHIFEPFYTTKEKGKGTGLGLSTVYGIVKQSGGNIWVYSEPGRGTTFKVYLPRVDAAATEGRRSIAPAVASGNETVLVVEDEDAVRRLAERILRKAGYTVFSAGSGGDALLLCEKHSDEIDLLLTDVVMPQMSGRELADRLAKLCPSLKVLYTSGYTDNAIVQHGVLDPGTRFIGKPFSAADLTRKVRDVLDEDPK